MDNGKVTTDELADMIKHGFDEVGSRLDKLEQGQTDIKARLDSSVYRFEFYALEQRVESLELKLKEKN